MIEYKKKYLEKLWIPNHVQWWQAVPVLAKSSDVNFKSIECRIHDIVYKENTAEYRKAFEQERLVEKLSKNYV